MCVLKDFFLNRMMQLLRDIKDQVYFKLPNQYSCISTIFITCYDHRKADLEVHFDVSLTGLEVVFLTKSLVSPKSLVKPLTKQKVESKSNYLDVVEV